MADTIMREAALDHRRLSQGPSPTASLHAMPHVARFSFRGDPAAAAIAGAAFGTALSSEPCRATQAGDRAALWLGPDEWLLEATEADAGAIEESLAAALASVPNALVNIGHRNVGMELAGARAADVLAAGCPLDLHELAFPVGGCTRTVLAKAEIVLWRTGPARFYIGVWRSFAPYVWDFLIEARTRL